MDDGALRYVHLASDIAHLMAAGAWVGALTAFVLLARPSATPGKVALLSRTSNGFAQVGTLVVATLTITGAVNYWLIVGPILPDLSITSYGGLLVSKLALFAMMLALAAANSFRLSPQLERAVRTGDHTVAVRTLRRSLMWEPVLRRLRLRSSLLWEFCRHRECSVYRWKQSTLLADFCGHNKEMS
ncbi:CopD family protein [Cupriavidus basilensis]